ncbi:hypothetical protein [Streptomyces sp. NPDC016845]|uniref:hypothetical protein n=1 Tax=Streptomyces sp. NPDC016845 TaxID=3364972 RepID=UPI003798553E
MTIRLWERRRRVAACAVIGTVVALLTSALIVVLVGPRLPAAWWPQTGDAFRASSPSPVRDAAAVHEQAPPDGASATSSVCDAVVGPAHGFCLGAPPPAAAPDHPLALAESWPLGVLAIGITTLYVLHRRRQGL